MVSTSFSAKIASNITENLQQNEINELLAHCIITEHCVYLHTH